MHTMCVKDFVPLHCTDLLGSSVTSMNLLSLKPLISWNPWVSSFVFCLRLGMSSWCLWLLWIRMRATPGWISTIVIQKRNATPTAILSLVCIPLLFLSIFSYFSGCSLDKTRFPSGMNNLTDQIHAIGMKAGIVSQLTAKVDRICLHAVQYSDSGWFTCQIYPGSYKNEVRYGKTFYLPSLY